MKPLNRTIGPVYWPPSLLNLPANHTPLRWMAEQYGWKMDPGDRYDAVRSYDSRKILNSRIVQRMQPSEQTYTPWPIDGTIPYCELWGPNPAYFRAATRKSWESLMEKLKGDASSLGAAAAEGRETFDMVARRAMGLRRAYKQLRRGDFKKFLKELSVDPKRKHRSKVRSAANEASGLWLEYWFGWSPTANDIGNALLAMGSNPIIATVREFGVGRQDLQEKSVSLGNGRSSGNGAYMRRITSSGKVFVKQGATFKLENQNLFLANRLGLVNPLAIAWEVVPFSFVVDWFSNVGAYIESFTDLVGLSYTDAYTTAYDKIGIRGEYGYFDHPVYRPAICEWQQHRMSRKIGLTRPLPTTPRLLNFGSSKTRAASAVSLLTTMFLHGR